jgi:hypothetical protein
MGGVTLGGKLYLMVQERAYRGQDVVRFLKHLSRHIAGKLLVLGDGASIHRSRVVKDYLSRGAAQRTGAVPQLCAGVEPRRGDLELLETGGTEEPLLPKYFPSQL